MLYGKVVLLSPFKKNSCLIETNDGEYFYCDISNLHDSERKRLNSGQFVFFKKGHFSHEIKLTGIV